MGELLALLTALIWAAAVILLKRSGETIPPFALNLFRVTVSIVLLVPTAAPKPATASLVSPASTARFPRITAASQE